MPVQLTFTGDHTHDLLADFRVMAEAIGYSGAAKPQPEAAPAAPPPPPPNAPVEPAAQPDEFVYWLRDGGEKTAKTEKTVVKHLVASFAECADLDEINDLAEQNESLLGVLTESSVREISRAIANRRTELEAERVENTPADDGESAASEPVDTPEAPDDDKPLMERAKDALQALMAARGQGVALQLLLDHGADRLSKLAEDKAEAFITAAQKSIEEGA